MKIRLKNSNLTKSIKLLFNKYREYILYIIFGGLTTVVNFAVYYALNIFVWYIIANIIAWAVSVVFAFVTNKIFVFESKNTSDKKTLTEFIEFTLFRVLSGVMETALLYVFVDLLSQSENIFKIIISVLVVVLNYIFSKFIIFSKKK